MSNEAFKTALPLCRTLVVVQIVPVTWYESASMVWAGPKGCQWGSDVSFSPFSFHLDRVLARGSGWLGRMCGDER